MSHYGVGKVRVLGVTGLKGATTSVQIPVWCKRRREQVE